ncbi:ATP phosphoribosyltransferase, partial [Neisseria sp. P0022.S010]
LKANGLEAVEHVADISRRLVVNKAALKTKYELLNPIIQTFEDAAKAV